ncbi:hypothetical protein NDU88_001635 [Pleurodeles waltl]|uniref:Uncharacterized protein n=1 Tax=Pleurodeles waltl TaxID=8319 RepID=A0AAV7LY66_PLEWA|nr:hypothetical protein NDU88_001635 [Pleurodeles waltl]
MRHGAPNRLKQGSDYPRRAALVEMEAGFTFLQLVRGPTTSRLLVRRSSGAMALWTLEPYCVTAGPGETSTGRTSEAFLS